MSEMKTSVTYNVSLDFCDKHLRTSDFCHLCTMITLSLRKLNSCNYHLFDDKIVEQILL